MAKIKRFYLLIAALVCSGKLSYAKAALNDEECELFVRSFKYLYDNCTYYSGGGLCSTGISSHLEDIQNQSWFSGLSDAFESGNVWINLEQCFKKFGMDRGSTNECNALKACDDFNSFGCTEQYGWGDNVCGYVNLDFSCDNGAYRTDWVTCSSCPTYNSKTVNSDTTENGTYAGSGTAISACYVPTNLTFSDTTGSWNFGYNCYYSEN